MNEEGVEFFFSSFDLVVSATHEEQLGLYPLWIGVLFQCFEELLRRSLKAKKSA